MPINVKKYLNTNLFEGLGLDNVTPEERLRFIDSFGTVVQSRLVLRLMKELSDDQQAELEKLMQQHPNEDTAVSGFLQSEVPDFQKMVEEEIATYKKQLLDRFQAK